MVEYSIILVEPKYEGNIGSVARVMKNFGFRELILVKPPKLGKDARKMAAHAQDILQRAKIFKNFDDLKKEKFDFLIATSAVIASDRNTLRTPVLPKQLGNSLTLKKGKIGLVFGREDYGLRNEEIKSCDILVTIPTSKEYPTLNVTQACCILLYELSNLERELKGKKRKFREANLVEKKILLEKFNALVDVIYKYEPRRRLAKKTFRTLIGRAFISGRESSTLTGIFRKAEEKIKKIFLKKKQENKKKS
jgi:TrmH family RNA methyltransferase